MDWILPGGLALLMSAGISEALNLAWPWNTLAFFGLITLLAGVLLLCFKALDQLFSEDNGTLQNYGVLVETNYGSITLSPKRVAPEDAEAYSPDHIIKDKIIYLPDLVKGLPTPTIMGKYFERCLIKGPAWVYPMDNLNFHRTGFGGYSPDTTFRGFPEGTGFNGVIGLRQSTFNDCKFENVVFVGSISLIETMKQAILTGATTRV